MSAIVIDPARSTCVIVCRIDNVLVPMCNVRAPGNEGMGSWLALVRVCVFGTSGALMNAVIV
jgi:hypothetical protein